MMAIPKWLKDKTPQEKGRRYEKKLAKELRVKPQPASGALPLYKEDIEFEDWLIQVKHTTKKSYTIKLEDLTKLRNNATKIGKHPMLVLNIGGFQWKMVL